MARLLRIERCADCPHRWWTNAPVQRCRHPEMPGRRGGWPAVVADANSRTGIDIWSEVHPSCPLPEAEEVSDGAAES